jgi:hypothetical protein
MSFYWTERLFSNKDMCIETYWFNSFTLLTRNTSKRNWHTYMLELLKSGGPLMKSYSYEVTKTWMRQTNKQSHFQKKASSVYILSTGKLALKWSVWLVFIRQTFRKKISVILSISSINHINKGFFSWFQTFAVFWMVYDSQPPRSQHTPRNSLLPEHQ